MIDIVLPFLLLAASAVPSGAADRAASLVDPRHVAASWDSTAASLDSLRLQPIAEHDSAARARPSSARSDSVLVLPEVRVETERLIAARRRLPTAFVTELDTRSSARALETLSEALAEAAGVRILQYGGLGSFSTVSLRGAPPGQVAIYLDGVPLTSAAHGVVNLADLPATAVERIEVYRGVSPLAWGAPLPGGAINLVTVTAPEVREARLSSGSFGTREALASAGARRGPFAALLHAGYQGSNGGFTFLDDNDTALETGDDVVATRINNEFDAHTLLGTLTWSAPMSVDVRLRGDHFEKRQGFPGRGANQAREASLGFTRTIGQLEILREAHGPWPRLDVQGAIGREALGLDVVEDHLGIGRHLTDDRFDDHGARAALEWPALPLGLGFEASASTREEGARLTDARDGAPDPPESRRTSRGAALALRLRVLRDAITLHAAQRWDRIEDRLRWQSGFAAGRSDIARELVTPQLGIRCVAPRGIELRANWTDARRVPGFLELFGNQGATQGNPALRDERSETWDAGLAWSRARGRTGVGGAIEYAHHEARARDLIVFVRNSPNSSKATNLSRASIRGDELAARLAAPFAISARVSFTWQSARDRGEVPFWFGKRLPQRPARQWYACLEWSPRPLRLAGDALFVGENFLDRYNRQPVPSRLLIGASASVALFRERLRLVVEGKNLGDERASDVGGYPLPGRSLYVSCQARTRNHSH